MPRKFLYLKQKLNQHDGDVYRLSEDRKRIERDTDRDNSFSSLRGGRIWHRWNERRAGEAAAAVAG